MPVPDQAARQFASALRNAVTMTWPDIKAHRMRCGLTAVQVAALAVQREWYIRLSPYRMSERPGLGVAGQHAPGAEAGPDDDPADDH